MVKRLKPGRDDRNLCIEQRESVPLSVSVGRSLCSFQIYTLDRSLQSNPILLSPFFNQSNNVIVRNCTNDRIISDHIGRYCNVRRLSGWINRIFVQMLSCTIGINQLYRSRRAGIPINWIRGLFVNRKRPEMWDFDNRSNGDTRGDLIFHFFQLHRLTIHYAHPKYIKLPTYLPIQRWT